MVGCGLGGIVNSVKKVGKFAVKSGVSDVADMAVDEAINLIPMPAIAKKDTSNAVKHEMHYITGTGINPYLPSNLSGGSLSSNNNTNLSYLSSNIQGSELSKPTSNLNTQLSYISSGIHGKKY